MKRKLTTKRTVDKVLRAPVRKHSKRIGEIAWAWNELHTHFLAVFVGLVDPKDFHVGAKIWHASYSDSTQRDMLKAMIEYRLPKQKRLRNALLWALNETHKLSGFRNIFVHAPVKYAIDSNGKIYAQLNKFVSPERFHRVSAVDTEKLRKKLKGDLIELRFYVTGLDLCIGTGERYSLPKRPQLQCYVMLTPRSKRKKRSKRPSQPRPSRT